MTISINLEKTSLDRLDFELELLNSDKFYNQLAYNKDELQVVELVKEYDESNELGAERFFLKDGEIYIGILEYLEENPQDKSTWIGLLLIKKEYQSKGYGYQAYHLFEELMIEKGKKKLKLGVILENEPAHLFWKKQGYQEIKTVTKDNKQIVVYEKILLI